MTQDRHHDRQGIAVTSAGAEAVRLLDSAIEAMLAQRADAPTILDDSLRADPGLAAGHCLRGFQRLIAARRPSLEAARLDLASARAALGARGGTRRERGLVRALAAWQEQGDMWDAAEVLERLLLEEPRDLLALRLSHAIRFMLGDAPGMRIAIEHVLPAWTRGVPARGFVLGCHAFALEETGDIDAAEYVGRGAVELEPADIWGAHAVAHALEHQARARDGLAWLAATESRLGPVGCFKRHIFWHCALFHLRLGREDAALALYDSRIRDQPSEEVRDIMNAASLLWRLHRRGVALGRRWEELADIAERRIGEHAWAFADLHYVLCLAASGRHAKVEAMLASIRSRMLQSGDTQSRVHAEVGLAAAQAAGAACNSVPGPVVRAMLAPVTGRLLGGSNVQRKLVDLLVAEQAPGARHRRRLNEAGHAPHSFA